MKQGYTDLTLLLDRSGSMQAIQADTIGGIRSLIEAQKKEPGECRLTFIQFDKNEDGFCYEEMFKETPIADVHNLSLTPRGWTPLLDAVGRMINETGKRLSDKPEHERPEHVIVIIATDGEENSSVELTREQIKKMIQHQTEAYNWKFSYIGANQDAFEEAAKMGIPVAGVLCFADNSMGTQAAYTSASAAVSNLRNNKATTMCYNDDDYKKQRDAGAKVWHSSTT